MTTAETPADASSSSLVPAAKPIAAAKTREPALAPPKEPDEEESTPEKRAQVEQSSGPHPAPKAKGGEKGKTLREFTTYRDAETILDGFWSDPITGKQHRYTSTDHNDETGEFSHQSWGWKEVIYR